MVEKVHCKKVMQHDKLAKSVMDCLKQISTTTLTNVHKRWKRVLHLIWAGKGGNDLVEKKCSKEGTDGLDNLLPTLPEVDIKDNMKKFAELTEVDLFDDENDMVLDEELLDDEGDELD